MTTSTPNQLQRADSNTRYLVLAWVILMGLTGLSWYLGSNHGVGPALATSAILVIAFSKVFLVGRSFMELRHAAPILQGLFAGWCVITCAALIAIAL